jgi:hypothetical protein
MITRSPLPPHPPRAESGTWPDSEALLADRTAAMVELTRRSLAIGGLVRLWLTGAVAVIGWAALGLTVQGFEEGGLGNVAGLVALVLGAVFLGAAGTALGLWLRHGRDVRRRLGAWACLGPELVVDVRLRAQGRCVSWLLPSVALSLLGGWAVVRGAARPGSVTVGETVYALGLGITILVTGLLGVVRVVGHQRWSERLLSAVPVRKGGGVHR